MAILNFRSIFEKSLAHPYVARNVMLKFQKNCPPVSAPWDKKLHSLFLLDTCTHHN